MDDSTEEGRKAHERAEEERRVWLDARGVAELPLAVNAELHLREWDDATGSFVLGVEVAGYGTLQRRPRSPEPWPEADPGGRRWSDSTWDWCLSGDLTLSAEQLALLEVRLAKTT